MTKFKICGLTTCQEAEWVSEAQADYAGMVLFFPKSKRNISVTQAEKIIQALPDEIVGGGCRVAGHRSDPTA